MTHHLDRDLAGLIEGLAVEPDRRRRERLLIEAARRASGACAAWLWRRSPAGWRAVAGQGAPGEEPDAGQVRAVAEGHLPGGPPPDRAVVVREDVALSLGGLPPDLDHADLQDTLESLLLAAALTRVPADARTLDWLHPALPTGACAGTHAVSAPDLADLRLLLGHLAEQEALLADLPPTEREARRAALDRGLEHAGDLLLARLGLGGARERATLGRIRDALGPRGGVEWLALGAGTAALPVDLEPATLLSLVLLLARAGGPRAHLEARLERRGLPGVLLRVHPSPGEQPPGESSLAELRRRAAAHGGVLEAGGRGDGRFPCLWLPVRRGREAA